MEGERRHSCHTGHSHATRALNLGPLPRSSAPQVSSWGGYVFLINLIPLHAFVLMVTGRFDSRAYVAYSTVNRARRGAAQEKNKENGHASP